jgi:NAD(P)-dependent dehydrogenase (short-subunit alcohol dehydrogenase family)
MQGRKAGGIWMSIRFANKVVLVIGGNSGIGRAAAIGYAEEGAQVVITGRDPKTLAEVEREIGPAALAIRSDVADRKPGFGDAAGARAARSHRRAVRECRHRHLCADSGSHTGTLGRSAQRQPARLFLRRAEGAAADGQGWQHRLYRVHRQLAGCAGQCHLCRRQGGTACIRVNMVSPGPTETPLINRNLGMDATAVDALRQMMIANTPMRRMGEPQEVARAVLFLSSDEASFITGVDLFVDGGVIEL